MVGTNDGARTLVWDLPVRVFHWLLAALIALSWYTVEISGNMRIHMLSGYTILTLVLFRLVWGFVGPRYARFRSMLFGPAAIAAYAKDFLSRKRSGYPGHTPLGSLSVLVMLALVAVQATTGLFATDEDFYTGPLNKYLTRSAGHAVSELHEENFNFLLALIALHIATVLFYLVVKRENLIAAMVSGSKPRIRPSEPIASSRLGLAVALLAVAGAGVYALVTLA